MRTRLASLPLVLGTLALFACTVGERGSRRPPPYDPTGGGIAALPPPGKPPTPAEPPPPRRPDPDRIEGTPSTLVMWEPLAVEQQRFRDANPTSGGKTGLPVILVNASFVPRPQELRELRVHASRGAVAKISDHDMLQLLAEIEKTSFFDYAKPTAAVQGFFGNERARGRITIERDDQSVTLVSVRLQGLSPETKAIPAIYATVKDSILLMKNTTPSVGVSERILEKLDIDRVKRGEPPVTK